MPIDPEDQVRLHLIQSAEVASYISDRIYWIQLRERTTFPAATFQLVSRARTYVHGSMDPGGSGPHLMRLSFSIYDRSKATTKLIKDAMLRALKQFNACVNHQGGANFVLLERSVIDNESEPALYREIFDVNVWHS